MKQVLESYGTAIIALLVMSSLLVFFTGFSYGKWQGVENAIGSIAEASIAIAQNSTGNGTAFSDYKKKEVPTIYYVKECKIYEKCYIPVENCFYAKDYDGQAVSVKVTQMIDSNGEVFQPTEHDGITCLWFANPGVYQVYVEAVDMENRSGFVMVKLFVNKGVEA